MSAAIERLPAELIDIVTAGITLPDYQAFRLTSRQLYSVSLPTFCKTFFATVTTTLGAPSLNRLLNISSSAYLANAVTVVDVRLLNYNDYQILQEIDRVGIYPPPKRFPKVSAVKPQHISDESKLYEYVLENDDFANIVNPFAHALQTFPHLSGMRFRVHKQRNIEPRRSKFRLDEKRFQHKCLHIVLDAVIKSEIKLQHLSMPKGKNFDATGPSQNIIFPAFKFSIPRLLSLKESFSTLKSLILSINTGIFANSREPGWENAVTQFIATASSLEELSLNLDPPNQSGYSAAVLHSLAQAAEFESLKSFRLHGCICDEQDLTAFVLKHKQTLRRIRLEHVGLRNGSWRPLMTVFRDSLRLNYVRFACIRQELHLVTFAGKQGTRVYKFPGEKTQQGDQDTNGILTKAINEHCVGFEAVETVID